MVIAPCGSISTYGRYYVKVIIAQIFVYNDADLPKVQAFMKRYCRDTKVINLPEPQ